MVLALAISKKELIQIKNNYSKKTNDDVILLKPKYDVVFQSLFSDKNKEETSYFISAILGRKIQVLKVNTEVSQTREYPEEKVGRMDLIAHTEEGEIIHIEIQLVDYYNTASRLLYSLCQNVSKQLVRGEDYEQISKTITIGLLDYNMKELNDLNHMHTIWEIREKNNEKVLTDLAEIHIIEMKKAKYEYEKDPNNILAKWILFILDPNMQEVKNIMKENEEIKKTAEKLETLNDDEDVRKRAEILERWRLEEQWNRASLEEHYRKEFERALEEGKKVLEEEGKKVLEEERKQVIEQGIEQGIQQGIEQGIAKEKTEIVKKMLKNGIDIETISKITGLSEKEIKSIVD